VTQADLHKRLSDEILAAYLADNTKARVLQPDGEYVRAPRVGEAFSAQDHLMRVAEGAEEKVSERLVKVGVAS
jgi:polyphosphate kinase